MAAMLHEQRVSAFPVIDDDDKVIGVVSEADMLAKKVITGGWANCTGCSLPAGKRQDFRPCRAN
jgi:CBS-domain-containing membrane protein